MTASWGRGVYGDPCRECAYSWSHPHVDSVQLVSAAPALFRETFAGSSGDERTPSLGWSAKAYVFHVADNLQIWSNRVATARSTSHVLAVAEYDSDLLAQARNYEGSTLDEALTSLDHAAEHWTRVMAGERGEVSIDHPARGLLSLEDIGATNCHDTHHHLHDISRILAC